MLRQEELFRGIVADPDVNFGLDPSWCSLYPYQMRLRPGASAEAELRVRNYRDRPMKIEAALVAPGEWAVEPDVVRLEVPPRSQSAQALRIRIPAGWRPASPRLAIAADVVSDGRYLGQITEAVVEVQEG
jgi:hypothetical protein